MKKAYLDLIKFAFDKGAVISVWDGEEWQIKKSSSYKAVKDAVESVEEASMKIRINNEVVGSALVIPYGMDPEETVADYSVSPFFEEWDQNYFGEIK